MTQDVKKCIDSLIERIYGDSAEGVKHKKALNKIYYEMYKDIQNKVGVVEGSNCIKERMERATIELDILEILYEQGYTTLEELKKLEEKPVDGIVDEQEGLRKELKEAHRLIENLRKDVANRDIDKRNLKQKVYREQEKYLEMANEYKEFRVESKRQLEELRYLETQVDSKNLEVKEAEMAAAKAKQEMKAVNKEKEGLEDKVKEYKEIIKRLEEEVGKNKSTREKELEKQIEEERELYTQRIKILEGEIQGLKGKEGISTIVEMPSEEDVDEQEEKDEQGYVDVYPIRVINGKLPGELEFVEVGGVKKPIKTVRDVYTSIIEEYYRQIGFKEENTNKTEKEKELDEVAKVFGVGDERKLARVTPKEIAEAVNKEANKNRREKGRVLLTTEKTEIIKSKVGPANQKPIKIDLDEFDLDESLYITNIMGLPDRENLLDGLLYILNIREGNIKLGVRLGK